MSALPKASPHDGGTDVPLICRRPAQCVDAGFGPHRCSLCNPAFHVNNPEDQPVIDRITRNIKALIRSRAAQKAWRTRKRLKAARAAGKAPP